MIGHSVLDTAFLLIGPIPSLPFKASVPSIQGAVAISGLGYAMVLVSTFGRSQKAATRKGYNNDMNTSLIISGNFNLNKCDLYDNTGSSSKSCTYFNSYFYRITSGKKYFLISCNLKWNNQENRP